jgi:hypothetical protein
MDVNRDGRTDFIAARAFKSLNPFSKPEGQLLWLEAPEKPDGKWNEHVLVEGPDVAFVLADIDNDHKKEVIVTQFFTAQQLAIYECPVEWSKCGNGEG